MLPFIQNPLGVFPYRRLQYIAGTGTQYIDTGVKPDFAGGDRIEIQYYGEPMQQGQALVGFGSRNVTGGTVTNAVYQGGSAIIFGDSEGYTGVPFDYRHQHLLSISDTEVVDNGSVYAATPKRVTCDYSIYLFTLNNRGSALTSVNYSGMRLYDWKYYHNGVLTQHLIPVLNGNGVPCLYDKITGVLKYNAGTDQFLYQPLYLRELQYLESTGTQYITTDYLFDARNKGSELEIKFYLPTQSASANDSHFGARGPENNALYSNLTHIRVGEGNSGQSYFSIITRGQEHVFIFRNGIFSVDGVETDTGFLPSLEYEFDLFTFNAAGNHTTYIAPPGTRIYYCKFYQNGTLVHNFIPVLDFSCTPCMYDAVTRTFKYNAGTGTFNYA